MGGLCCGAENIRTRYQGSEVEAETERLILEIDAALELLAGHDQGNKDRLRGVLEAIDPAKSPALYERVRRAIEGASTDEDS